MNIKTLNVVVVFAAATSAVLPLRAVTPQVTYVSMTQSNLSRLVNIDYRFTGADAVITLDVQTNAPGGAWASIGGKAVCNATGEVWKKVTNDGTTHKIEWHPDLSWPDHVIADGGARAVITAWTLDNTPDYMAVDISATGGADTQTYYPSADFVPGGVTNDHYKTLTILMRKIMAKDVKWTMGSVAESYRTDANEEPHQVTLTNNYYIGVFEVTQTQWQRIAGYNPSDFKVENSMRPVEHICYKDIRQGQGTASSSADANGGVYPDPPYGNSFLGLLRAKTYIDFDLPSEAQWEFAARAGHGEGYWGDGSSLLITSTKSDANLAMLSRYYFNGGGVYNGTSYSAAPTTCGATNGTAVVGSYVPNSWGLYDMHGNVSEYCVDTFSASIKSLNGAVNTTGENYVVRGGSWGTSAPSCRSAYRNYGTPGYRYNLYGFRLACTAGLK